jgi:hypothetical protein
MTNYFQQCSTVAEVKSEYKRLAMLWHPDRPGGDTATMQVINAQYKTALSGKHGETTTGDDGQDHTYYYNDEREQAIIDKITEIIKSGVLTEGVELWLVGSWLWLRGETKQHKDKIGRKGLGFTWNGHETRRCWQWHLPSYRKTQLSNDDFDGIAARYGASRISSQQSTSLAS